MKVLVGASLFWMLLGCTSVSSTKKDPCGATVTVAPQPVMVGVCRE